MIASLPSRHIPIPCHTVCVHDKVSSNYGMALHICQLTSAGAQVTTLEFTDLQHGLRNLQSSFKSKPVHTLTCRVHVARTARLLREVY